MTRHSLLPALLTAAVATGALAIWLIPGNGRPAPDINVETLSGERMTLEAMEGSPVMLQFWATTCRTCVAEMPHLKDLHRELSPDGLRLVAVAMPYDPPDQVRTMAREKSLPYTIALDRNGKVTDAFGDVRVTPTTVLIDSQGRIAWMKRGKLDFERLSDELRERLDASEAG